VHADEVEAFINARYVCAPEACHRLFGYRLGFKWPPVQRLALHLPHEQPVVFTDSTDLTAVRARGAPATTLTAYFDYMRAHPEDKLACTLLYHEFPEHYAWHQSEKTWRPSARAGRSVVRMYIVRAKQEEVFHLRLLLTHVRGARSYEDLKTVNSRVAASFKEAARQRGLLADDDEWRRCLEECAQHYRPARVRELFELLLVNEQISDPMALWREFKHPLSDDFLFRRRQEMNRTAAAPPSLSVLRAAAENDTLLEMEAALKEHGMEHTKLGLPAPTYGRGGAGNRLLAEAYAHDPAQQAETAAHMVASTGASQRAAFDAIAAALPGGDGGRNHGRVFFLDGPATSGKTCLYNAQAAHVRGRGGIANMMASTTLVAMLMAGGHTTHSGMRLPIPMHPDATFNISQTSQLAELEADAWLCIDRTMRAVTGVDALFGGKVVVLGRDFRQTLPVKPHASQAESITCCLN
jgi:hypothetical protein